jgi:CheY-like chemotaxis protein
MNNDINRPALDNSISYNIDSVQEMMKNFKNRIMVVDDEEFILSSTMQMLQLACIDVDKKCDFLMTSEESLNHLIKTYKLGFSYSYIFTDFSMPVMDGIKSTRKIMHFMEFETKILRHEQPIIIGVTGHVNKEYHSEVLRAGMDNVLNKPFYLNSI